MTPRPCDDARFATRARVVVGWFFAALVAGCAPAPPPLSDVAPMDAREAATGVVEIECTNSTCPTVAIAGERVASPPFRGVGDPSLEFDPSTSALWLSYSSLAPYESAGQTLFGVSLALARSDDGGRTFRKVSDLATVTRTSEPTRMLATMHEFSTVALGPSGAVAAWLDYTQTFIEGGRDRRADLHLRLATAPSLDALPAATPERWLRGTVSGTDDLGRVVLEPPTPVRFDSSVVPGHACLTFTEPTLYASNGRMFLAANCIRAIAPADYSLELFELDPRAPTSARPRWIGTLLDGADAVALGATSLEQADLALARDGSLLLLVTQVTGPLACTGAPTHRGCLVLEVDDIDRAHVRRGERGPWVRARIGADMVSTAPGPGLCTYDRNSETGVLIVGTRCGANGLTFELRRTGLHP